MQFKLSFLFKVVAILCSIISIILIVKFDAVHSWLVDYSSSNIIEEEEIMNPRRIAILKIGMILMISVGFSLSLALFLNLHQKLYNSLIGVVDIKRINGIFFIDEQLTSNSLAIKTFIFSSLFAIIIHLRQLILGDDVKEDIFEHISETFLLVSSMLFFVVIFKLKYLKVSKIQKQTIRVVFTFFGLGLFFVFLEEISYGQHIFKWKTAGIFETYNFQNETNLHNFINPLYRFIYPFVGFGLFGIFSMLWFFNKSEVPKWLAFLTPHKSLIILMFLMAASTYKGHSESFEHMFSLFVLIYVWRLLLILKFNQANQLA